MAEMTGKGGIMSDGEAVGYFAWIIIVLFILSALANALVHLLPEGTLGTDTFLNWFTGFFGPYLLIFYIISALISLALLGFIFYLRFHIEEIVTEEKEKLSPSGGDQEYIFGTQQKEVKNPRWERIITHMESESPGEWRVAVLEADILLEELLEVIGYHGETIGERLKQVEKSDFTTLDQAWEAHKIRNQIAHEGSDYHLTAREAQRVIELYRKVFEEFHYV